MQPKRRKYLRNKSSGETRTHHLSSGVFFNIPASDLSMIIRNRTNPAHQCSLRSLANMLLAAGSEVDREMTNNGADLPSAGQEYVAEMPGVELRLLKIFRPPLGFLTYDQLRSVILGLQLFMLIGEQSWEIHFTVMYGKDRVGLGRGVVRVPPVEQSILLDSRDGIA